MRRKVNLKDQIGRILWICESEEDIEKLATLLSSNKLVIEVDGALYEVKPSISRVRGFVTLRGEMRKLEGGK